VAFALYTADHNGLLPRRGQGVQQVRLIDRPEDWFNALPPYLGIQPYSELASAGLSPRAGDKSIFVCPSAKENPKARHFLCYGMNMYLSRWDKSEPTRAHRLPDPATLALMADSPGGYASTVPSSAPFSVEPRHSGNANVLFLDGRVQSFHGEYLGCGRGDITHADVRWKTLEPGDNWSPGR
jgi:prepilin-type processing-associated H-X9-DG protein